MKREDQKEQTAFRHLLKKHGHAAEMLATFDIETLDLFERRQYDHFIKQSTKEQVLQILINNVEGDYSQLSEGLAAIAELQDNQLNNP